MHDVHTVIWCHPPAVNPELRMRILFKGRIENNLKKKCYVNRTFGKAQNQSLYFPGGKKCYCGETDKDLGPNNITILISHMSFVLSPALRSCQV